MHERILQEAENLKDSMVTHRRHLHQLAETGFSLTRTREYVESVLTTLGYIPRRCGKIGITAVAGAGKPCILLRADMDALPIRETSGESFASENGNTHACGHDMHTAMLLGAAELLKKMESELQGTVKLMFQGAEEILSGAKDMLENGVLTDPEPSAAVMIHVMSGVPVPTGTVLVPAPGIVAPAADMFAITVQGKGCHGSMPAAGIDPLTVAARILLSLSDLPAREFPPSARAVVTAGSLRGGEAANVIPDAAVLLGSVRSWDEDVQRKAAGRIEEITHHTAKAFRANARVEWGEGCPSFIQEERTTTAAGKYIKELLGEGAKTAAAFGKDGTGSEDFAYISQKIPSVMLALAAGHPEDGYTQPLHHPAVRFDEKALCTGCSVFTYTALRFLRDFGQ